MSYALLESPPNPSSQWGMIIVGAITLLYIAFVRPLRKGKRADPLERTPSQLSLSQQRAVEREMTSLLVEYEDMLRRMSAQLDTRSAKLELLIREADDKIGQLRAAEARADRLPMREAAAAFALPAESTPAPLHPKVQHDPRYTEVYDLADQGQTPRQIAHALNRPFGEVELILALRGARP